MIEVGIYVTEILKYGCFLKYCLNEDLRRLWLGMVLFLPYIAAVLLGMPQVVAVLFFVGIALLFMTKRIYGKVIISVVFLDCFSELLIVLVRKAISCFDMLLSDEEYYLITNSIILVAVLLYSVLIKAGKVKKIRIPAKFVYIILGVAAWSMLMVTSMLQFLHEYIQNDAVNWMTDVVFIFAIAGILVLLLTVLYIYQLDEQIKESYHMEHMLKEAQETYYQALLEKETDTRKYRHDMANHVVCLTGLIGEGNITGAAEYLERMNQQLSIINQKVYYTGNHVFDILLNYYMGMLDSGVQVQVVGRFAGSLLLDNFTICTIFSNLLRNAVEEIGRGQKEGTALSVQIDNGEANTKVEIKNTSRKFNLKEARTTKSDKKNHGFGLENVRKAVEKSHGIFEIDYEDGEFTAMVYLPYKVKGRD